MSRFDQHVPDILDCLAQLSNDEVPTSPKLASAMLDLLPEHVWHEPNYRWLNPFSKSGVFLREIATRLLDGLEAWEPDFLARREHIFRNMLYGAAITEMTGIISRRSVYCTADASSAYSVVRFDDPDGNIPYVPSTHDFNADGRCRLCNGPRDLERGDMRENYAYSFIHGTYPTEELADMKFDVIVGNPPYQIDSDGNTRTMPVYQKFVERAIEMDPRYVLMITPSRWFTGGLGLDEFRARMIADRHLSNLVDNPKLFDCFPGVEIKGGVSYFLWDRDHDGDCEFSTRVNGKIISTMTRDLRAGDGVLMRDNLAASIVEKVRARSLPTVEARFAPQVPFGFRTNYGGASDEPFSGGIPLVYGNKVGYVRPDQLERLHDWVDRWKVLIPKAGDGHGREISYVLGEPIALAPGSACTQTYLIAASFDSEEETRNYANYMATKLYRFLVLQRKVTQDLTSDRFRFVPMLDMTRPWTDGQLYDYFNLTDDERRYVESSIAPRGVNWSLDSPIPASHLPGGSKYKPGKSADADDED
ncbi:MULTISPECIES: Eco57I restriction-modification methylase domain-containing protein [Mycobacteriales]|uniref:Eco57I restriction-modification methylase domain-containing protein n=2 Tax=Gordonia TaxID=2053 RepID=A0AAE4U993_9ACTN|nr:MULTISPECIES: Eco57I restriction-modification methylase domain-containing protein [Mycobacteriales]KHJ71260.1 restriction endonuclease Eco57I [Rhodococcus sp. Chr-9]MDV6312108.1 Eco57I restriction-modification methylase domain-containing protein [Gordonia amicalis]HNP55903.1 Eco57I restriction-modification methylase domain-containing protein [Gordonia sp. (in: high G+C Gram-positive bacteria)]HRC51844.1 Eco57I restriction-modification methylase domain-containing protein [Gordonia sp. (in: hi